MFKRNNRVFDFVCLIYDIVLIIGAFVLSYILRVHHDPRPLLETVYARDFLISTLTIVPFWIMIFWVIGLYSPKTSRKPFRLIWRIILGCLIGMMALVSIAYMFELTIFPARWAIIYALGIAILVLIFARLLLLSVFKIISRRNPARIILIGNSEIAHDIAKQVLTSSDNKLIATLGIKVDDVAEYPDTDSLLDKLKKLKPDAIIQTDGDDNTTVLASAQKHFIAYNFIAADPELYAGNNITAVSWGYPIITVAPTPLVGWNVIIG